jgi:hypothetical protein
MIITYDDVKDGIQNRTNLKTLDNIFLKNIEHGAKCPPFVSNAILEIAKRIFHLDTSKNDDDFIKPGQLKVVGILSSEPAGKALKDCQSGVCTVTFNNGQEDQQIRFRDGVSALRRARILRITEEALDQGIHLTQEDLAYNIFSCGLRTIRRDIKALRDKRLYVPTRGQQKDIGPGVSHKVIAVRMFLERKTELEIARTIYHSLKAIERYTNTFSRVILLLDKGFSPFEVSFIVQISQRLVDQYQQLYHDFNRPKYKQRLDELLNKAKKGSRLVKKNLKDGHKEVISL